MQHPHLFEVLVSINKLKLMLLRMELVHNVATGFH